MNSLRLVKEFKDIQANPLSDLNISVGLPDENDIHKWRVILMAPEDSNYNGGIFQLEIIFPFTVWTCIFFSKISYFTFIKLFVLSIFSTLF